jgi:hypothetical protein
MPNVVSPRADEPGEDEVHAFIRRVLDQAAITPVTEYMRSSAGASRSLPDFNLALERQREFLRQFLGTGSL